MLLFGFPFAITSPARAPVAHAAIHAVSSPPASRPDDDKPAMHPTGEREVGGLGHYIDNRFCGERFHIGG